jgi:hypothetical protein
VGISREWWGLREGTPPNKKNAFQTRKILFKQEKYFSNKKNAFQTRKTPFKQEKYFSSKETSFNQGVSSNQM